MSHHNISVFFEMTERNGTVVCFDGVCPMCLKIMSLIRSIWEPRGVGFVLLQAEWVRRRLNLPEAELRGEMRVLTLTSRGKVLGGADAHGHLWGQVWWLWPLWLAAKLPGVHWLIDVSYRWVAANRYRLMPVKDACDERCAIPNSVSNKTKNERT